MSDWTSDSSPKLLRILVSTTCVPDLALAEKAYTDYLSHRVVARGEIDASLAQSWGTPAMAGARTTLLVAQGEQDVFLRLIEAPRPAGYRALTTFGWNAFEIIVDDVFTLHDSLQGSPFRVIGEPRPLQFMPSIIAMQVIGPGEECLYFTMESGDRETSILPNPSGFIGRTFIVVSAGPDFSELMRWYVQHFDLRERPVRNSKVQVIQQAQVLSADQTIELCAIGMAQHGNLIELDGYPHGPGFCATYRPRAEGMLPPGNAIVSAEVDSLEPYLGMAILPPERRSDPVYNGRNAMTVRAPGDALLELIERG